MSKLLPACVSEFIGTFALCFVGIMSIVLLNPATGAGSPAVGLVTIALAHGLILFAMISGCGYISGAQFNPAVSIALLVAGKQDLQRTIVFIGVQLLSAACAAGMVQLLLTPAVANAPSVRLGATIGSLTDAGNIIGVVGIEAIITFVLAFVGLTSAVDKRGSMAPLAIGMAVAGCILAAGPLTGASMNPARTFGPAICGRHWAMFPAYIIGPLLGASLAGIVYRQIWAKA
jgi:MIP family channel proteins